MQAKPWLISLAIFPFSVAYLWSRWKTFRARAARATSKRERQIVDVERWMWIGLGVTLLGVVGLAFALFRDSNEQPFFVVVGAGLVITFLASIVSGWMRGGSVE